MRAVVTLLLDMYAAAVLLDWLLARTPLAVQPGIRAKLRGVVEPFLAWVRRTVQPSFNRVDLSRGVAIVVLFVTRSLVQVLIPW